MSDLTLNVSYVVLSAGLWLWATMFVALSILELVTYSPFGEYYPSFWGFEVILVSMGTIFFLGGAIFLRKGLR